MKKFIFWFFTISQIVLIAGIFVIDRLSDKYMTMNRIILYKNRNWEAELPIENLLLGCKVILIALTLIALISLIVLVIKNKTFDFYGFLQLFGLAVIAGVSFLFITVSSVDALLIYYFAVTLLITITAIQLIKVLLLFIGNISLKKQH